MRVLVTGSAGFVGSHVVRVLRDHTDWRLRLFDAKNGDVWGDVPPADVVVSLAASANPTEALRDPAKAYANGTRVMVETLEYARKVGARVLHVSTNEVYGDRVGPVYAPRGAYAGAKACQEIVCETYQDVSVTVVVTQSLFGERQQPNKLVPTAIRRLLAGEAIPLQRGDVGWASRPFLHVSNLAEALRFLCERESPSRVHVGASRTLTLPAVVAALAGALDCDPVIEAVPAGDRAGHELDVEPIGCDLDGWRPTYDAIPALHDAACWYRDNPGWLEVPGEMAGSHTAHSAPPREARRAA